MQYAFVAPRERDVGRRILLYISQTSEIDFPELQEFVVTTLGQTVAEDLMTTAEKLRREGREQGLEQGRKSLVLRLLTLKFGSPPHAVTTRIEQATDEELDRFAERILTAGSVEEVVG